MGTAGNKQRGIPIKVAGSKELGADKMSRNTAKFDAGAPRLRKPSWIRVKLPSGNAVESLKSRLRERELVTVCEEASCPNIHECFHKGTATFMILGEVCTRRCSFCDVAHGRPLPPDENEPAQLARTVKEMGLRYIVITSVDRDDLRDGGAGHFAESIRCTREVVRGIRIEVLVPDFRGRNKIDRALDILTETPPDVFNHNIETVEPLYRDVRPGADYRWSLQLLERFKARNPGIPTKSGIMLGLGESRRADPLVLLPGAALLGAAGFRGTGRLRLRTGLHPHGLGPAGALFLPCRRECRGSGHSRERQVIRK